MIYIIRKKNMEENKIEEYVNMLVERALAVNKSLGYTETDKLMGDETLVEADAILRTWPTAGLTMEDAEEIARIYNSKIEEAKMERAADQYAKDGVTAEEVEYEGNEVESGATEISNDRENEEEQK